MEINKHMQNIKIQASIIIPIYNSDKYIRTCLESILKTKYLDFEVICVDDGSTDDSLKICREYEKYDARIRVITQCNKGVSAARNIGIENANGKWLLFCDSDDTMILDDFFRKLDVSDEYDMLLFSTVWGNSVNIGTYKIFTEIDKIDLLRRLIQSRSLSDDVTCPLRSPCFKAYRKSYILNKNIRFPEGVVIGEDFIFNTIALSKFNKIMYIPVSIYCVVEREGSATHSFVSDMLDKEVIFQQKFREELKNTGLFCYLEEEYESEVKSGILRCLRKQIFYKNKYTFAEKYLLVSKLLKCDVFKNSINSYDDNIKRNIVIWLLKHKKIRLLEIVFSL